MSRTEIPLSLLFDQWPKIPTYCQRCGEKEPVRGSLIVWEECDEHDCPCGVYIPLCHRCSDNGIIDSHPLLYEARTSCQEDFCPGAMPQCGNCKYREGFKCSLRGTLVMRKAELGPFIFDLPGGSRALPEDWPTCISRVGVVSESPSGLPQTEEKG